MDQDQDRVADFGRKRTIAFQMLDPMEQFRVGERLAFVNVGLSDLVSGLIVEIFSSKSSGINGPIARIMLFDNVLLD